MKYYRLPQHRAAEAAAPLAPAADGLVARHDEALTGANTYLCLALSLVAESMLTWACEQKHEYAIP